MKKQLDFIVAIVGSAGSHTGLMQLFDHKTIGNLRFVLFTDLAEKMRRELESLVERRNSQKIIEVGANTSINDSYFYWVPPGRFVTISRNTLHLHPDVKSKNSNGNVFMNSMAAHSGARSIGIVLSGTTPEGAGGLEAIHRVGGLTMAQDPQSCEFSAMPVNAIKSGFITRIADCSRMPAILKHYVLRFINSQAPE